MDPHANLCCHLEIPAETSAQQAILVNMKDILLCSKNSYGLRCLGDVNMISDLTI